MLPNVPRKFTVDAALRDLRDKDDRVRAVAAGALDRAPLERRDEVCRVLRDALDDGAPDVRYAAALSLGELADVQALDRLIRMLEDQDVMPRQAAAIALGRIGHSDAVAPLIKALAEGSADVRFQAVASLVELSDTRAVQPIIDALADRDPEVRASAAAGLGDLRAHEAADALALLLGDSEERVRLEAAYALSRLGDARGLDTLCQLTTHRDFGFLACEALGGLGSREAVPALQRAWRRFFVHPLTRVRAAASLLQLGDVAPRAYLVKQLRSRRPEVRGLALELVGELGGAWALELLLEALRGPSPDAAARALGSLGNPAAVSPLREALARAIEARDDELKEDIQAALAKLEALR